MQYFDFKGLSISALGFGSMRLPTIDGDEANIDEEATAQMVQEALDGGVNYFDTAWGYHGGNSELVMGRVLSAFPRNSFYLATKFPTYDVSNFGKHEEIFARQLEKCQVDHFDFYLMHNVNEGNIEHYLDNARYGTIDFFREQRASGRIGHLGFSVHGAFDTFERFMDAYGEDMEFCQIQINYMDWDFQKARLKVEYLQQRNMPIAVMEPLRGGNLVRLGEEDLSALEAARPGKSALDWAFKWVAGIPGVYTVLSGMSNIEQLRENLGIFDDPVRLSAEDRAVIESVGKRIAASKGVPCTACRYCTSECPQELDIPRLLELYNEHVSRDAGQFIAPMAVGSMPEDKRPSACIGCGACEAVCPQQIPIPDTLKAFAEMLA